MSTIAERTEAAIDVVVLLLKIRCPKDTGNLSLFGIRKAFNPVTMQWEIVIGAELAPYAPFTNEPWISPRWHGKPNPNEAWIQNTIINNEELIRSMFMDMDMQEINVEQDAYQQVLDKQFEDLAKGVL